MGFLHRRTQTRYHDAHGKRCRKSDPGAVKTTTKLREWYGTYKDRDGIQQTVRLSPNKQAAKAMLAEIERKAALGQAGLLDPFEEHTKRPLRDHIDDFRRHLEAKGSSDKHIVKTDGYLTRISDDCGFRFLGDIDADQITAVLADHRDSPRFYCHACQRFYLDESKECPACCKPLRRRSPLSIAGSNGHVTAWKTFCRWLVSRKRISADPMAGVEKLNAATDRRRVRRAATDEEFAGLLASAASGKPFRGLTGPDRVVLYLVAVNSGLRVSELASLTEQSFDFTDAGATLTIEAGDAKNRKDGQLPLRTDVADIVRAWLFERRQSGSPTVPMAGTSTIPLWPGTWTEKAARMLRRDLEAAEIAYCDDAGRVLDFHGLRHTFGTNLARSGVHPRVAQELMRHSDINLTMRTYSHVRLHDLTAAVESMPGLASPKSETGKATGTDDAVTAMVTVTRDKIGRASCRERV